MYDVLVFDHRRGEHRQLDSKSELTRLLFGYTTGNGQKFPAQPELVIFVSRPGSDELPGAPFDGDEAIRRVRAVRGKYILRFVYLAAGERREGDIHWSRNGLRVR